MLIAADIGNTNIVIGFLDSDGMIDTYRIATDSGCTSDEYGLKLTQLLDLTGIVPDDVTDVIISSVVPQVMHSFKAGILKFLGLEPMVVGQGTKSGLSIRIDDPKSLGADCLADCVGAYHLYGGPVLVIDFGTATTFNYVNANRCITCGLITPGLRTCARALWQGTAQLPEVEITRPNTILATETKTAMQAGLFYDFLGGTERIIEQFRRELKEDFTVVATGGLSSVLKGETDMIDVYDPDLIFKGMLQIYTQTIDRPSSHRAGGAARTPGAHRLQ
ncbi:type III pantothenate kinase [Bifidobacterium bombi DSM 19703]|uniref:Type III pantothenate kinase n=1 Tax=Bifidobacterium bombi DSM 19703 TaxID=1341695 RepID=A0A080N298_9BIFI|nr:type III pantothenate kinase [Bifidobacterium bombi DSM 19703]